MTTEDRRELIMWRGVSVLCLLIMLALQIGKWLDDSRRLATNHEAIITLNHNLLQCAGCHSHPDLKDKLKPVK